VKRRRLTTPDKAGPKYYLRTEFLPRGKHSLYPVYQQFNGLEKNDNNKKQKIQCNDKFQNYLKLTRGAYKGKGKKLLSP